MYSNVVRVTPELAKEWLKKNIDNNRNVSWKTVYAYANDMKNGKWELNGQSIDFDESDRLINGQHRLHAVVSAGVPVDLYCTFGVPNGSLRYDEQNKRTLAAVLHMGGANVTGYEVGIASMLATVYRDGKVASARTDAMAIIHLDEETIHTAAKYTVFSNGGKRIAKRAPCGAAAWVYLKNGYPADKISRFFECVASGFMNGDKETAAIVCRNFIINERFSRGDRGRIELFYVTCAALKDFISENRRKLNYDVDVARKNEAVEGTIAGLELQKALIR